MGSQRICALGSDDVTSSPAAFDMQEKARLSMRDAPQSVGAQSQSIFEFTDNLARLSTAAEVLDLMIGIASPQQHVADGMRFIGRAQIDDTPGDQMTSHMGSGPRSVGREQCIDTAERFPARSYDDGIARE
jgi:hypothetical protein